MITTKIGLSLLSIVVALSLMAGATFAYFTDDATSNGNTFDTGTLEVSITDPNANSVFQNEKLATDWQPGDATVVNFDVRNTGSLPVHLSGVAGGTWGDTNLDNKDMVKVTRIERWDGSAWDVLRNDTNGIEGVFYFTGNGTSGGTPIVVDPNDRANFRLTVVFDEEAGSDFEGKTFTSGLKVVATQTNAPFPTDIPLP